MGPWSGRTRTLAAVGVLAAVVALLAIASGDASTRALRATAVVGLLAAAAFAVRRRRPGGDGPSRTVTVHERHPLGKETGVAVIALPGRRLLVGYGPAGVTAIAELGATQPEGAP